MMARMKRNVSLTKANGRSTIYKGTLVKIIEQKDGYCIVEKSDHEFFTAYDLSLIHI